MRVGFIVVLLVSATCFGQPVNIIPAPLDIVSKTGTAFYFSKGIRIKANSTDTKLTSIANQLQADLLNSKKLIENNNQSTGTVVLKLLPGHSTPDTDETYAIHVYTDSVVLEADAYAGLFYACVSLKQLLLNAAANGHIACMDITDGPVYKYRGMHLDVCRHFFNKEVIKQYLDLMAELKLNVFHWHLTDDQGWRIEIKKYPRLAEVGSWRTEADGSRYGGFYTQNDIKEILPWYPKLNYRGIHRPPLPLTRGFRAHQTNPSKYR